MLFDKDGVIKRYESPQAILAEFFELRLEYYHRRHVFLLKVGRHRDCQQSTCFGRLPYCPRALSAAAGQPCGVGRALPCQPPPGLLAAAGCNNALAFRLRSSGWL